MFKNQELGADKTRIALIVYNKEANFEFNFLNFKDIVNVERIINGIAFSGGFTNTAAALQLANTNIFREINGMRPGKKILKRIASLKEI